MSPVLFTTGQNADSMPQTTTAPGHRPLTLPDRAVSRDTITQAYMQFIFYCNPALPPDCDSGSLEEAFRNPPRSGGKVFEPFAIYELVRLFYNKEIKTWTELTITLGVEPPDITKDESAQKVAQYGVRLKKWMHSMHVKSFFEYLMDIPNEYWTDVPQDSNPISRPIRDGVAVEDDMALRALLPHIRPKRGRKRPEQEDASSTPSQKPRVSPSNLNDDIASDANNMAASSFDQIQTPATAWPSQDVPQIPLSRWPQSAATPTIKGAFWGDDALEPKSAITPSKPSQRRGAKNVSSAWRLGGLENGSKTRGRPPINRTPIDTPNMSNATWTPTQASYEIPRDLTSQPPYVNGNASQPPLHPPAAPFTHPKPPAPPPKPNQTGSENPRPARPSISLQVPERQGGAVRLATPPPPPQAPPRGQSIGEQLAAVTGNQTQNGGTGHPTVNKVSTPWDKAAATSQSAPEPPTASEFDPPRESIPDYYFATVENRHNIDDLIAYFVRASIGADWFEIDGSPGKRATVDEANAITNATLQNMYRSSNTIKEFLINLAALAGARMLMTGVSRCQRLGEHDGHTSYQCEWEYRFGTLSGYFNMVVNVPFSMWRAKQNKDDAGKGLCADGAQLTAEQWQEKYRELLLEMERKDMELFRLKNSVVASLGSGNNS